MVGRNIHVFWGQDTNLHRSQIFRPARNASRSDAGGEFVSDAGSGSGILRLRTPKFFASTTLTLLTRGLEPPRVAPYGPEPYASANSAT